VLKLKEMYAEYCFYIIVDKWYHIFIHTHQNYWTHCSFFPS